MQCDRCGTPLSDADIERRDILIRTMEEQPIYYNVSVDKLIGRLCDKCINSNT